MIRLRKLGIEKRWDSFSFQAWNKCQGLGVLLGSP